MAPLSIVRRATTAVLLSLLAIAFTPGLAGAAQPATVRLLATNPVYPTTTFTMPDGKTVKGTSGLFLLRVTPTGGTAVDRPGFCVDALHGISPNTNYSVSLRTAVDDPLLASARYAEAAWLIQSAEGLIAAAPASSRSLEAGALQTAIWQLTDQVRETNPTADAALNARTAALRALAAGRAIGGPLSATPSTTRGCAGRSAVTLNLTGTPGSSASLAVTGGPGVVSPAEVRFAADGTAQALVTSATAGTVGVTVRSEGGTLTRLARTGAQGPQETMLLVPQSYSVTTSVVFEDCPVIPFEQPKVPVAPLDTKPAPVAPTAPTPRTPSQSAPKFVVAKSGPASVLAGATARYTIRVTNRGTGALSGLTLTDELPVGMSLASTPSGARLKGGKVVWDLASIKAGATRVVHLDVRVDAGIVGRRCNRATATVPGATSRVGTACTVVKAVRRAILPAVTG